MTRPKYGTDSPHEPTDEFIVQAFAHGAGSLWPDSRDPGWQAVFRRWLAAREAKSSAEALREALANVRTHNGTPVTPENLRWAARHEALARSYIFDVLDALADALEATT